MKNIQDFLVLAAVNTGSGAANDGGRTLGALNEFLATVSKRRERAALCAVRLGLQDMRFSGALSDKLNTHVEARIARLGVPPGYASTD